MSVRVTVLQADHGDCLLVSYLGDGGPFNILIDGGTVNTFRRPNGAPGPLRLILDNINASGQSIDLCVLTHIDSDHIGGMKRAFETDGYLGTITKKLWYNSSILITEATKTPDIIENHVKFDKDENPQTSFRQAFTLENKILSGNYWHKNLILAGQKHTEGLFTLTVLSPCKSDIFKLATKWPKEFISPYTSGKRKDINKSFASLLSEDLFVDDDAPANRSSISFLLELGHFRALFLADAPDDVVRQSLTSLGYSESNKLKVNFVKVSHHGSQCNTSQEFLSMIDSSGFFFSTNGMIHQHPDRLTIARILRQHPQAKLYFNYQGVISQTFSNVELVTYASNISTIQSLDFCL